MAVAAYRLLRDSARIFLEASPRGLDPRAVEAAIRGVDGVTDVHELHVWEVTSGFPALSAHVLVDSGVDCHERRIAIETVLGTVRASTTPRSRSTTAATCSPLPTWDDACTPTPTTPSLTAGAGTVGGRRRVAHCHHGR